MVQRLKESVRTQIVAAATTLFAEQGYEASSIANVAERAGISTGNVYRYFESKEALFAAAVPEEFAVELRERTRVRIEALGAVQDIRLLPPGDRYHVLAGDLLEFSIAHRERVVILLSRAHGTPFATFESAFRRKLIEWALAYVRVAWPQIDVTPSMRFALDRIYAAFLGSMAHALSTFDDAAKIREAVRYLTAHHQGGLLRLFEIAATDSDLERPSPPHAPSSTRRPT